MTDLEAKKEVIREYQREWRRQDRLRNPEKYKRYYEANRDKFREASRKHESSPERKAYKAALYQEFKSRAPEYIMLKNAQARANHLGLAFNIEQADIQIPTFCPILEIPLFVSRGKVGPNSPTLDRVDTTQGYIKGNVRVISHAANSRKSDLTFRQIERLFLYSKGAL